MNDECFRKSLIEITDKNLLNNFVNEIFGYDLKNDPGLFKLYKLYYGEDDVQIHDAFNDCEVTALVYKAFKDDVNLITNKVEVLRRELE